MFYKKKYCRDDLYLILLKDMLKLIANNKYMHDYDLNKQSTFITYLDNNNLYGWAMSVYLPYGEFEW